MIKFNLNVFNRGLPGPVTGIEPVTSLANHAPTQVTSALAAAGTVINQATKSIPTGLSIGTKYICILTTDHSDCMSLPLKPPAAIQHISSSIPHLEQLIGLLKHIPALEVFLWLGLASNLTSTIAYSVRPLFPIMRVFSAVWSILGLVWWIVFATLTFIIVRVAAGQTGDVHKGAIGNLIASVFHVTVSVVSWKYDNVTKTRQKRVTWC